MSKVQCFKIKRGTEYDKAVKQHFELLPRWKNVIKQVGELLGEKIKEISADPKTLYVNVDELTKEDNFNLFTNGGKIKSNLKKAKEVNEQYKTIVKDEGLLEYRSLGFINFGFGIMRFQGQSLKSFKTSENDIYYEADFNLADKAEGLVEPISHIEYQEKYLEELKKSEKEAS